MDTLGHLLALKVTAANQQERAQVGELMRQVPQTTTGNVKIYFADQGSTGEQPAKEALQHGVTLEIVQLAEAQKGFVLLPRRWVMERTSAWQARFRRLSRDYERLPATLPGLHWLTATFLMLNTSFRMHNTL